MYMFLIFFIMEISVLINNKLKSKYISLVNKIYFISYSECNYIINIVFYIFKAIINSI